MLPIKGGRYWHPPLSKFRFHVKWNFYICTINIFHFANHCLNSYVFGVHVFLLNKIKIQLGFIQRFESQEF